MTTSVMKLFALTSSAVFLSVAAFPSLADDVSGVISGYVTDDHGQAIKHVVVSADTVDTPEITHTTDQNGFFSFLGLLPGKYIITARAHRAEFCPVVASVIPGISTRINLRLSRRRPYERCLYVEPDSSIIF